MIKVESVDNNKKNMDLLTVQNVRNNEQGLIQELHRESYKTKVKVVAE